MFLNNVRIMAKCGYNAPKAIPENAFVRSLSAGCHSPVKLLEKQVNLFLTKLSLMCSFVCKIKIRLFNLFPCFYELSMCHHVKHVKYLYENNLK